MSEIWDRAVLAARVQTADPGIGLWLRARPGPARDAFLAMLGPMRRLHPGLTDDALTGGMDVAATLAGGAPVMRAGLLSGGAICVLGMAERCPPGLAARLAGALDAGRVRLVCIDEGAEPEETLPRALAERLGLFVSLEGLGMCDPVGLDPVSPLVVHLARDHLADLTRAAAMLGISSLRAPLQAAAIARALARLDGRDSVGPDDLRQAAMLAYAHRASPPPEDAPEDAQDEAPPPPAEGAPDAETREGDTPPEDMMVDAALAALPRDLLDRLAAGRATPSSGGGGAGAAKRGNRRGRPLPARAGRLDGQARLDLVATLRAAAPWQTIRRRDALVARPVHLRPGDMRLRRYQQMSDRLLIFAVDASGSAAMARLAEAKGAVELLLAQAYARRDHVALIAFRGAGAQILLPPTRSLVQTKRRLAALPGGGGTPLAAGLQAAMELSRQARAQGYTPALVLMTDGRANIALDGTADRARAGGDAAAVAGGMRGIGGMVVDTGRRPSADLVALAATLGTPYLTLPRADARSLGGAVAATLG